MKQRSWWQIAFFLGIALGTALGQANAEKTTKPRLLLGVLVDTSPHQKNVIGFEREALNSISEQFGGMATESFVFTYAGEVKLVQDWSASAIGLKSASSLIGLDFQNGKYERTQLYDAINAGLLKLGSPTESASRILIVIGEGNDSGSSVRFSQIKKLARSNQIQVFAMLVADHNLMGGRVRHFGWDIYDLASATKGAGYDIEHSHKNLDKALRKVLKRIVEQSSRRAFRPQ